MSEITENKTDGVKQVSCPSCSSPLDIRSLGRGSTLGCAYCGTVIDIETPELKIISEAKKLVSKPKIEIGKKGKISGITFQIIGYIYRTDNNREYFWSEYLLFNPYHGYRWLSEYDNHWQFVTPLPYVPDIYTTNSYNNEKYKKFSEGYSVIVEVIGELYWQAKIGDSVKTLDFILPPKAVGLEVSTVEISASEYRYMPIEELEEAFGEIKKSFFNYSRSVSPTQVNLHKNGLWSEVAIFGILLTVLFIFQFYIGITALNKRVLNETFDLVKTNEVVSPGVTATDSAAARMIITSPFQLVNKVSNFEVLIESQLENSWLYTDVTLASTDGSFIDEQSVEVSYYHGYDSDGRWTEGSTVRTLLFSSVPPGEYKLRIEPEMPKEEFSKAPGAWNVSANNKKIISPNKIHIIAKQDVPYWTNFAVAFFALLIFPAIKIFRCASFENQRWQESNLGSVLDNFTTGD